jgi:hypothetical protein
MALRLKGTPVPGITALKPVPRQWHGLSSFPPVTGGGLSFIFSAISCALATQNQDLAK